MGFTFNEFPWTKYYDSDLREVLKYMKEFEAKIDSYDEVIAELQDALEDIDGYDARITALENATADLASIRSRLTDLENTLDADVIYLQKQIDAISFELGSLGDTISSLKDYIDNKYNTIAVDISNKIYQIYVDMWTMFNGLKDRIIALAEILNNIDTSVYNPWPRIIGKESIQKNIDYAYSDLADNVPTAQEYSELGLSADDYNEYELSAYEYSVRGRKWLHLDFVYSPVYGFKQNISNVLTSIVNFIQDTLTATEFSELELTADDYTALDLTAQAYYSFMANEGYLRLGRDGITAQQYTSIGL